MKNPSVYTLLYNGSQHSEISGEFSLPDYLPDVRKVLRVTSDPHITGKFMNGEHLELEGEVGITLIYFSEEQTVCAFSASLPFSQSVTVSGLDETAVITAHLHADGSTCRLTGPRKCTLRSRPVLYIRAAAQRDITPDTSSISDASRLCVKTVPIPTTDLICIGKDSLRYAEDIAITDGVITTVLSCTVIPTVAECRSSVGHAVCKGEFDICALCAILTDKGCEYRSLHRRVPFSEVLEADGITEIYRCEPDLTVTAVTPTVTEEGHNLGIDFSCDAAVICAADRMTEIITDAYLPDCDIRIQGEPQTVFRPLKTVIGAFSASTTISHDPQEHVHSVIDCSMHPSLERRDIKNGRLTLDGTMDVSLICSTEEGKYLPLSASVPIHWDTDGSALPDTSALILYADCTVSGTTLRIDASTNSIVCDAELSVCLSVSAKETHALPSALKVHADNKISAQPRESLIFYYPEQNESVWDIAKRYRITPQALISANALDAQTETVTDGIPLIIPVCPLFAKMKA